MRFIGGHDIPTLLKTLERVARNGYIPIIDYAREGARNAFDVVIYKNTINTLLNNLVSNPELCRDHIAFACKLSSYAPFAPAANISEFLHMVKLLPHSHKSVFFDAEHTYTRASEDFIFNKMIENHQDTPELSLYKTYQMYRKDSMKAIESDLNTFDKLGLKIVRGAYHSATDSELFSQKHETDENYNASIQFLYEYMMKHPQKEIRVCFATHNALSVQLALKRMSNVPNISYGGLLDMGESIGRELVDQKQCVYKYVPYGSFYETLPYLIRRLYENKGVLRHAMT